MVKIEFSFMLLKVLVLILFALSTEASSTPPQPIAAYYSGKFYTYSEFLDIEKSINIGGSTNLTAVEFYTRIFEINWPLDVLQIELVIPFVGFSNGGGGSRARILLTVNDRILADASMRGSTGDLRPILLKAMLADVSIGTVKVQVKVAVDGGTLEIPHFNPAKIEKTIERSLFAKYHLLGFPAKKSAAKKCSKKSKDIKKKIEDEENTND